MIKPTPASLLRHSLTMFWTLKLAIKTLLILCSHYNIIRQSSLQPLSSRPPRLPTAPTHLGFVEVSPDHINAYCSLPGRGGWEVMKEIFSLVLLKLVSYSSGPRTRALDHHRTAAALLSHFSNYTPRVKLCFT